MSSYLQPLQRSDNMNERINKQRLFDYFAGKATDFEKQQIAEWSRESANEEQFYGWLDEWEREHLQYRANQRTALGRYHDFLFTDQTTATNSSVPPATLPRSAGQFSRYTWLLWAVAASVTILVGILGFQGPLLTRTYETAYGETRTVRLPDGSTVTLNSNSSLQIPRFGFGTQWFGQTIGAPGRFGGPTRQVQLTGEALFSVAHTATNQRFVVKTANGPEVVVLGTEFTVFARPRGTKVVLNRGKVEVHYQQPDRQPKQVTMKPGDLLTLTPKGELQQQHTRQVPAGPAWADHRFVFDKTTLAEIVAMLDENYGLRVNITDDETGRLTLSGAYPAQNADELLRIVAEVLNLSITRQNDTVLLSPKPI
ncbi:MAG: FecR domain-containing protein [Bacteroidetes bacterium]|nr:FecR domain-containing protein [Fibrella sp.]